MGLTPPASGRILFQEEDITGMRPHLLYRKGIKLVPQERRIFPTLSVEENLRLALIHTPKGAAGDNLGTIYERFPILQARRSQKGGLLSGGEKQMLAIARAIVGETKLMLLDEPTEGLAPIIIQNIQEIIREIQRDVSILLAEQNVHMALELAQRHYILDRGTILFEGSSEDLRQDPEIMEKHLGVSLNR